MYSDPGDEAMLMVYNATLTGADDAAGEGAYQRGVAPADAWGAIVRGAYDANEAGDAAPVTEFVDTGELRLMLGRFSDVSVRKLPTPSCSAGVRFVVRSRESGC